MKRLITAAILLFFVISAYLSGLFLIKNRCDKANRLLEDCVTAYDNAAEPEKAAEKLRDFWSKAEKPLSVFVNHSRVDEIEKSIDTLLIYSTTDQNEIFKEYSGEIKTLLHQLMEDATPSVHSVF